MEITEAEVSRTVQDSKVATNKDKLRSMAKPKVKEILLKAMEGLLLVLEEVLEWTSPVQFLWAT
jgi:hypothetical protein